VIFQGFALIAEEFRQKYLALVCLEFLGYFAELLQEISA
jgi:hypothetical protein